MIRLPGNNRHKLGNNRNGLGNNKHRLGKTRRSLARFKRKRVKFWRNRPRYRSSGFRVFLFIVIWACGLGLLTVALPVMLVQQIGSEDGAWFHWEARAPLVLEEGGLTVPVYRSKLDQIEEVPLEAYVRGVVAAEMPIQFQLEALKAQAIAARTYIIRRMEAGRFEDVPGGAWVTDTVQHQVFKSEHELRAQWGWLRYGSNMDKLNQAVNETAGQIVTYQGAPIDAVFFSTSNGYTENSEEYWSEYVPYLRSVPSPWDAALSPRFKTTMQFSYSELSRKLGLSDSPGTEASAMPGTEAGAMPGTEASATPGMEAGTSPGTGATANTTTVTASNAVLASTSSILWTEGHRIKQIRIGGRNFTGREVREKLGLASSQFDWNSGEAGVEIVSYGYGHGVGMSQYGANGMALEGKTAQEIIQYYYRGVNIEHFQLGKV